MGLKKESPASSSKGIINRHYQDTKFDNQLEKVNDSFFKKPQTMKEVDVSIGIMRENICWHCRKLREQGHLYIGEKRTCKITGHKANAYTTNPELLPPQDSVQLILF